MATISASAAVTSVVSRFPSVSTTGSGPALHLAASGLARMRGGRVKCSTEKKVEVAAAVSQGATSMLAAAAVTGFSSPALALVDERLSTEGTCLPLGLSNNLLGWILLGVFGLIWSLYIVYTSGLDEDEESVLSL